VGIQAHPVADWSKDYDLCIMTLFSRILLGLLAFGLGLSWAQTQPPSKVSNSDLNAEWMFEILVAEMQVSQGEVGAGFSLMLDAARKSGDEGLYERAVDIALKSRAGDAALQAASAWRQAAPESIGANRKLLQIQVALQRIQDAQPVLRQVVTLTPEVERDALILGMPRLLARSNDKALAAKVLQNALTPWLTEPRSGVAAWVAIGQMQLLAGSPSAALKAAQQGHALSQPRTEPVWLGLELAAQSDDALNWLQGVMPQVSDPDLLLSWSKLLIQKGKLDVAEQSLLDRTLTSPTDATPWLLLGAVRLELKNTAGASEAWQRYLKETQGQPKLARQRDQALLGLAQISLDAKQDRLAIQWLQQVSEADHLLRARLMQATVLGRQGEIEKGRALITGMRASTQKQELTRTMAEVQYLRQFKQWQAAYDVLSEAAEHFDDDEEVAYELALASEKLGKLKEMESILQGLIEQNPKFYQAYNALGFSWADRSVRLDEAKTLITQALQMAPEDAYITDSLGWVEFRLGHLNEARAILQNAYDSAHDVEIAAHLGEVLWAMNQREEALAIWRQALQQNNENETLVDTLRRLGVKP
jgi:tetratricopeptide (TPR) repeat protein